MYKNILILNQTRMGDLIQSTPLIAGFRKQYPDAKITLAVNKGFAEFAKKIPCVDDLKVFDIGQFNGMDLNKELLWVALYRYLKEVLDDLKEGNFDLVVNLSHSVLSAYMIKYLGIPEVRGFLCSDEGNRNTSHPWFQYFFTEPMNRAYNTFNLVDMFSRGGDVEPDHKGVMVETGPEDEQETDQILIDNGIGQDELVIGIQAGSSIADRRWPASKFGQLADSLIEKLGARIVLFGVASESELSDEILSLSSHPDRITNLCGKTSISQLTGMVKRCRYLVTNDTGTMHIAAAVGTPSVGLFFAHAHPYETGPYSEGNIIFRARIECAPCSYQVHCNNVVCVEKVLPEHLSAMIEGHVQAGKWVVPEFMKNLREVDLLETYFDDENFLMFRPLIEHPLETDMVFALAYRRMWRDTLCRDEGGISLEKLDDSIQLLQNHYRIEDEAGIKILMNHKLDQLDQLTGVVQKGKEISSQLVKHCQGKHWDSNMIQAWGGEIAEIDEKIGRIGLTHPELNPMGHIFTLRKENFDGENLLELSKNTVKCYERFEREAEILKQALNHLMDSIFKKKDRNDYADFKSIRMAVPGR